MNSFKLIDIISFIGISQSLFLAIALQMLTDKNRSANRILSILLFVTALFLSSRISYFKSFRLSITINTVMFLFGLLIHLYIRRLILEDQKKHTLSLYHYIPTILYLIFIVFDFFYTPEYLRNNNYYMFYRFFLIEIIAITLNLYYAFKSHQLLKSYQKQEKNNFSYNQNIISFLRPVIIATAVTQFLWLIILSNTFLFRFNLLFINFSLVWGSILIIVYFIGYYSLKQPDIFRIKLKTDSKKTRKKRMSDTALIQLQKELELLMENDKIYLENQLTLVKLAEKLNTSSNNISWLLNSVYNCSFYEYTNRYRIKDFINKIEDGAHAKYTLLELSMDSGFNSKSTFNKAFKAEMNDTPSNYIKNLHLN